ncbi:Uncharacterized membrane protein [Rhizobium sp. NFR07]|uniref:DUF2243 domain-containing protein n=1 Tax=Rhizobium sp. NFR07 TaxID=1566262 RepID=UPI0008EA6EE6|nr:DUF2243 domain-containing protein [Rhizobium sp. NFR07]SFB50872.1 Uncharacterized membrane protein [Rhizobium sp. NFR07]
MSTTSTSTRHLPRKLVWAGIALGFGLGGFFDGILLHQVLQWHHLLSGLEDARLDLRTLILTDGLFHVLMYIITCCGLWALWRRRSDVNWLVPDRTMVAFAAAGFGLWHIVDSILSHWLLGIHRVRMNVENPLLWDLIWFFAFGVMPVIAAAYLTKFPPAPRTTILSSPLALVIATFTTGSAALLPAPQSGTVMVMFRPGMNVSQTVAAIGSIDGRIVWTDDTMQVWAIKLTKPERALELYLEGAMLVGNSILPAGCFGWTSPSVDKAGPRPQSRER